MSKETLDPFVEQALKKLFKPTGHFSICDFDNICAALNVIPPRGHRDRLALVHCVSYRDMKEELRHEVGQLVLESLSSPGFNIQITMDAPLGRGKLQAIK